MGGDRLRDRVRRFPASRRAAGGSPRATADVHGRDRRVHGGVGAVRALVVGGLARRIPWDPGPRRRAAGSRGPVPADDDLRRGS